MTDISIDLVSVLGIRSDGWVSVKAAPARESSAGGWVSGARDKVPMTGGMATLTGVEPGPAVLTITTDENNPVSSRWSESWLVTVPDSAVPVPFRDLVDGQTDWPAPVVKAAQVARAAAEAAAATAVAEADRARQAADEAEEGGVRPGGWLLDDLAQEVLDQLGGGVALPIGIADVTGLQDELDSIASSFPSLVAMIEAPVPASRIEGGAVGTVLTSGAGGVAAWAAAAGGGASGIAVSGPYQSGAPNNAGPVVDPTVSKDSQVVIGSGASALNSGVVIGTDAKSTDPNGFSVAVGMGAEAGNDGTAVGRQAKANFKSSVAVGDRAAATKANQVMLGRTTDVVTIPNRAEVGTGSIQVTLSTRLEAGKVQFGITWPGSSTFVPIVSQP